MNIRICKNINEHGDSFGTYEDFLLMCVKMKNMLEDELGCGIFFPEKYYVEK